jgi:dUTP pyrophosphatase
MSRYIPDLKITKVKCVRTPERAYQFDAGIDFFVPNFLNPIGFFPGQRKMIPSGIHAKIPHGFMLKAEDKSGVGTKKGLKYIGGVIDEGYSGEIHICLFNTSKEKVVIHAGEKIIQFILIPVLYSNVELVNSLEELYPEKTERGSGGFGSSGNGVWDGFPSFKKSGKEIDFKQQYLGTFDIEKDKKNE